MAPEQKDDIVCAFHGDLEQRLDRIEGKIDGIRQQMNEMLLWRASVKGAATVVAGLVSFFMTVIVLVIKDAITKR